MIISNKQQFPRKEPKRTKSKGGKSWLSVWSEGLPATMRAKHEKAQRMNNRGLSAAIPPDRRAPPQIRAKHGKA